MQNKRKPVWMKANVLQFWDSKLSRRHMKCRSELWQRMDMLPETRRNINRRTTRDSRTDADTSEAACGLADEARCGIMVRCVHRGGSGHSCHFWQKADARSCSSLSFSLSQRAFIYVLVGCSPPTSTTFPPNTITAHYLSLLSYTFKAFSRRSFKCLW